MFAHEVGQIIRQNSHETAYPYGANLASVNQLPRLRGPAVKDSGEIPHRKQILFGVNVFQC